MPSPRGDLARKTIAELNGKDELGVIRDLSGIVQAEVARNDSDPFLRRTLQCMVDDIRIYATSIRPGPETAPDAAAWNDASVAYGGPFDVCHRLGVQW